MRLRKCLFTGQLFYPKKNNQKFIDNKARSNYHNQKYRSIYMELYETNKSLFRNYKILSQLIRLSGFIEIEKKVLKKLRYNFSLCTGIDEEDGLKSFSLYDIRLIYLNDYKILIKRYENK